MECECGLFCLDGRWSLIMLHRFLLAKLQLQSVIRSATNAKDLFALLAKLPFGINEMYRLTLERIDAQDENHASLAHRLFVWLLHAKDARDLKVLDIQHALAVCPDSHVYDEQAITAVEVIVAACHGLVVVQLDMWGGKVFRFVRKWLYIRSDCLQESDRSNS